jgi:hypothetical protein
LKDGTVLDEPVKIKDDFLDSLRYAIFSMGEYLGIGSPVPDAIKENEPVGYTVYETKDFDGVYESY